MKWLPLETDPATIQSYVRGLGGPKSVTCQDVLSTDDWAIDMLEGTVIGLLVLYPMDQFPDSKSTKEIDPETQPGIWFSKQTIGNACGTVGILHVMGNLDPSVQLEEGFLKQFYEKTKDMTPLERAKALETEREISQAHDVAAKESKTKVPTDDKECNHHFVVFVEKNGHIFELDGRRSGPIDHGQFTDGFARSAAAIIKTEYLDKAPQVNGFSILALAN